MQSSGIRAAHRGGAEYAEPFDTLRVSGFPPLMVSLSNHANSAVVRKNPFMVRQAHHERDGAMQIQVLSRSS